MFFQENNVLREILIEYLPIASIRERTEQTSQNRKLTTTTPLAAARQAKAARKIT